MDISISISTFFSKFNTVFVFFSKKESGYLPYSFSHMSELRYYHFYFQFLEYKMSDNMDYPPLIFTPSGVKHLTRPHCCQSQQIGENRCFTYLLQIIVGGATRTRAELPCRAAAIHACLLRPQIVFQHIFLTHPSNSWDLFYRLVHVYMHPCITYGITFFVESSF
jgi:hypothetical protein